MLRATKILSACLFMVLMLANCEQLNAATYEVGPFQVEGFGATAEEAEENAYGEAWDVMVAIDAMLPPGDEIVEFVVEYEELILPTTYVLEFHLVIEEAAGGGGGHHTGR